LEWLAAGKKMRIGVEIEGLVPIIRISLRGGCSGVEERGVMKKFPFSLEKMRKDHI